MTEIAAAIGKLLIALVRDWRAWAIAIVAGLALTVWVVTVERDAARQVGSERSARIEQLEAEAEVAETARRSALAARDQAESILAEYAVASAAAWREQAAASTRMAAQLTETNRRLRAAQEEITRADPGLRLDDPLPDGVRDGIACAGTPGTCEGSATADSRRVSAGAAGSPVEAGRSAGGDHRA